MFSLHETVQKRVCRAAFVVGCVVPTLWTIGWIVYFHRPWHRADWQRTLTQQLHLRATLDDFAYPRPGVTRLIGLELAELRSGKPLASIDKLRVQRHGGQLALVADQVELEARQFSALAAALDTWLSAADLPSVELRADRLTLVDRSPGSAENAAVSNRVEMTNLRVRGELVGQAPRRFWIQAELSDAGQTGGASTLTIQLVIQRTEDRLLATLDTKQSPLPVWLLAEVVPGWGRCPAARFTGALQIENNALGLRGSLTGRFDNVDLQQWVGPIAAPHRLAGTVDVKLDQLTWQNGRVDVAKGELHGAAGVVSRSLLSTAAKRLFCALGPRLSGAEKTSAEQPQAFDQLACRFRMTSVGITLSGTCSVDAQGARGCLLAVDRQPLLWEPGYVDLPVAQLVQALAQPAASWLPATREAHQMAGALPLPSAAETEAKQVAARPDATRDGPR